MIRRDNGEAQLEVIGNGGKAREVLIPAAIAGAPVFASVRNPGHALTERAVNYT